MTLRHLPLCLGMLALAAAPAHAQFAAPGAAQPEAQRGPELTPPPAVAGDVVSEDLPDRTIKAGIGLAETSPQYKSLQYFKDIVEQRSGGQIEVQIFPNSQVGDDVQMMQALQSGTLQMTYPSTSPAASIVPELKVFDLPFLFPDRQAAYAVMDGEVGQELLSKFEGTGLKALAFSENGYRQLTNSVRAVDEPGDVGGMGVAGLKVRTMQNPVQVDIWNALGANPTPMAFGEVFSALEQGVIEGQENPWSTILTSKFYEVQPYGTETRHVYTPFVLLISDDFWKDLDPKFQDLVQEAAVKSAEYERKISAEYDEWAKQELERRGMQITELTDEQRAAFREATKPVYEKWAPQIGRDLVERVQQTAESAGGQAAAD